MDGNRRWAKQKSLPVIAGHKEGVEALKKITRYCLDNSISDLTVYAFSTENWKRNSNELDFLFQLLSDVALRELKDLRELGVKVDFIGDISRFDKFDIQKNLNTLASETQVNSKLNMHIALNYGSLAEIAKVLTEIKADMSIEEIEKLQIADLNSRLYSKASPEPDLLIRTGGQQRLSNFLLWQSTSSKLVFTETLWPDFSTDELTEIITNNTSKETIGV